MAKHTCPVCGYPGLSEAPENFSICPSCGTEFGYHDSGVSYQELRDLWLREGAHWFSQVRMPPPKWNAYEQLISADLIPNTFAFAGFVAGIAGEVGVPSVNAVAKRAIYRKVDVPNATTYGVRRLRESHYLAG